MKKLLVLMMVLGIASAANAGLLISVDGVVNPPDSSIEIKPSDWVTIDIWGDGQTPQGEFFLGVQVGGPASFDIANGQILYTGNTKEMGLAGDFASYLYINDPYVRVVLLDLVSPPAVPVPLEGTLVDGIRLHCDAIGDVTLALFDIDGNVLDTQVIHQVPEPITIGLLGLGGLFLRRRK